VDTTAAHQQAKRQRQAAETIDLDDVDLDPALVCENAAPQQPGAHGSVGVKPERA